MIKESDACPLVLIDTEENKVFLSKHLWILESWCDEEIEEILKSEFDIPKSFDSLEDAEQYAQEISIRMDEIFFYNYDKNIRGISR